MEQWAIVVQGFLDFIYEKYPWIILVLGLLFILLIVLIIYKIGNGTMSLTLWKFRLESNKAVNEIQKQFDDLNKNTNLKTQILKLLNQAMITISQWNSLPKDEFLVKVKNFYDFFLPGITTILSKGDNSHRVAVFYLNENCKLKILYGYGYSPEGKENLELGLQDSKAGYSFTNGIMYHNNDITQDPSYVRNPKSSREYHSLVCIPIKYNDCTIGILNVDGLNRGSFEKDDLDYITYIANAISPILYKELFEEIDIREEEMDFETEKSL